MCIESREKNRVADKFSKEGLQMEPGQWHVWESKEGKLEEFYSDTYYHFLVFYRLHSEMVYLLQTLL